MNERKEGPFVGKGIEQWFSPGDVLPLGGGWQCVEIALIGTLEDVLWHLTGRGQGYCGMSCSAQDVPRTKNSLTLCQWHRGWETLPWSGRGCAAVSIARVER